MAKLLEARPIAQKIKAELACRVRALAARPVLVSILVGDNPGSASYVKSQEKCAEELGIDYRLHAFKSDVSEEELAGFLMKAGSDKKTNGVIIQMPLPSHIDQKKISRYIPADKDVEGLHPHNVGMLVFGKGRILPCTPAAVMALIESTGMDLKGKETVIVGHSEIVGKPLALMLVERLATVTVCHIGTSLADKLQEHVERAEILVVAAGKAHLIKGPWIREGAVVIDVGINRVGANIVGDVDFETARTRAAYITPVPGGVGPLTVVMLMRNLVEAAELAQSS